MNKSTDEIETMRAIVLTGCFISVVISSVIHARPDDIDSPILLIVVSMLTLWYTSFNVPIRDHYDPNKPASFNEFPSLSNSEWNKKMRPVYLTITIVFGLIYLGRKAWQFLETYFMTSP